jgi:hypothetical protein
LFYCEVDDGNFHGFKISHENALRVKNINPNGPIEFMTLGVLCKDKRSIDEYLDANLFSNNAKKSKKLSSHECNEAIEDPQNFNIYESIVEVRKKLFGIKTSDSTEPNSVFQFFSQLCTTLEHNFLLQEEYSREVYGAYTDCDQWFFATAKLNNNYNNINNNINNSNNNNNNNINNNNNVINSISSSSNTSKKFIINISKVKTFQEPLTDVFDDGAKQVIEYLFTMLLNGRHLSIDENKMQEMILNFDSLVDDKYTVKLQKEYDRLEMIKKLDEQNKQLAEKDKKLAKKDEKLADKNAKIRKLIIEKISLAENESDAATKKLNKEDITEKKRKKYEDIITSSKKTIIELNLELKNVE